MRAPFAHRRGPAPGTRDALARIFPPDRLITDPAVLATYAADAGLARGRPEAVALPETTAEVAALVGWAADAGRPVIARGAGTGLAGGAVAQEGGLVVALTRMDRLAIDAAARRATLGPGVTTAVLDAAARAQGLRYPPDPGSGRASTVGGNVATNAGGPRGVGDGVTARWVAALEVVLGDGRVARLDAASGAGDLLALLVGSEGTLGIVTEITVRLAPRAPATRTLLAAFPSLAAGAEAVVDLMAGGAAPARLELMDGRMIALVEAWRPCGLPRGAGAVLLADLEGAPGSLGPRSAALVAAARAHGATELRTADDAAARAALWRGRKEAGGAMARLAPAYHTVDVAVPRSAVAGLVGRIDAVCAGLDLDVGYLIHAGDGNLHPLLPFDPRDAASTARVHAAGEAIVDAALAAGGTVSGEHGIGLEKRAALARMLDAPTRAAHEDVRRAFDPAGRLNPGKILAPGGAGDSAPGPDGGVVTEAETAVETAVARTAGGSAQRAARGGARRVDSVPMDGVRPRSAAEAAAALAALGRAGMRGRIGSGPVALGRVPMRTDGLDAAPELDAAERMVRAGAGVPLATVARAAEAAGLRLAVASPWPDATLGGTLAAGLESPWAERHGPLRDQVAALTVALPDGRLLQAGRAVHKNVAGYDLARAFVGTWGRLGLLISATLRLTPHPEAAATRGLACPDAVTALALAERLSALWAAASVVVVDAPGAGQGGARRPWRVVASFEGHAADVAHALAEAEARAGDGAGADDARRIAAWAHGAADAPPEDGAPRRDDAWPVDGRGLDAHHGDDAKATWRSSRADGLSLWARALAPGGGRPAAHQVAVPWPRLAAFLDGGVAWRAGARVVVDAAARRAWVAPGHAAAAAALRSDARAAGGAAWPMDGAPSPADAVAADLRARLAARWDPTGVLWPVD